MGTRLPHAPVFNFLVKELLLPDPLPSFPQVVESPKYPIGARCRWIPIQHSDWGKVIGHVYLPQASSSNGKNCWSWIYLLLLDLDSPSRRWIIADWADEEHLEILSEQPPRSDSDLEGL